jgi:hypothetical protein
MFLIEITFGFLATMLVDLAASRLARCWHRRALDRRYRCLTQAASPVALRRAEANLRRARRTHYALRHQNPLVAACRFLTDRDYATEAMSVWFDRMSDAWCDALNGIAEGRNHWSHYDWHYTPAAHWQAFRFRVWARLARIHSWIFWQVDRAVMRLCLTVR